MMCTCTAARSTRNGSRLLQERNILTGYAHGDYARSLAEFGRPQPLPLCRGWILEREIPGCSCSDAMGCYPLFACEDWSHLHEDLQNLESAGYLVTLAVVADPFGDYDVAYLQQCFPQVVAPFKEHFAVDLSRSPADSVDAHHLRNARKARSLVDVELCPESAQVLEDWTRLYDNLIARHAIKGISAFSRASFARQLQVPGMVAMRARHEGTTVGMTLWLVQGNVVYYHLGAYSETGYALRASFALFWTAIEHFAERGLRWLNLGAGAGAAGAGTDGLTRFKRGWSTTTRTVYFCGRIFDNARYETMVRAREIAPTAYFPAYRQGEFA